MRYKIKTVHIIAFCLALLLMCMCVGCKRDGTENSSVTDTAGDIPTESTTNNQPDTPTGSNTGDNTEIPTQPECRHEYDHDCDPICNICGNSREIIHKYADRWTTDGDYHWRQCEVCGDKSEIGTHIYDNDCDTECNICKNKREITHKYADKWTADGDYHWKQCEVCGDKSEIGTHIYDNDCDTECNICKNKREITHTYADEWTTDGDSHWKQCEVCGDKSEIGTHVYDNDCDTECNICQNKREITHKYADEWTTDGDNHWKQCEVCGDKSKIGTHVYNNDCDTECNICQNKREITHKYADKWTTDGDSHWKQCEVCGDKSEIGTHVYDNDCDTECNICQNKREITHKYADKWTTDADNHWKQCEVCGDKSAFGSHSYDNACDADCNICSEKRIPADHKYGEHVFDTENHWLECVSCKEIINRQAHTFEKAYKNETTHNIKCVSCGYIKDTEEHVYVDDYCSCGYKNSCRHTGGEATCISRATCDNCGYEYGAFGDHRPEFVAGYGATCVKDGLTDGSKCSLCDTVLKKQETITAAHTVQVLPAVAPTCEKDGLTVGSKCSVCGETIKAQQTVKATGHSYSQTGYTPPSCTKEGSTTYKCDTCSDIKTEYSEPTGHRESAWITQNEATCENDGSEYKICLTCEAIIAQQTLNALGHSWDDGVIVPATCEEQGYTLYTCDICTKTEKRDFKDPLKHVIVIDDAISPTCTDSGLGEGRHCSRCGDVLVAQAIIKPLGHDEAQHDGKNATCTEAGWNAYVTCTRCDYTTYKETDALGHNEVQHDGKNATCTEDGWNAYVTCTRCDYTTYKEVDALGHNEVQHDGKNATCTEVGWNAYVTCTRCNYNTYKAVGALGHNWVVQADGSNKCMTKGGCGIVYAAPNKKGSSFDSFYVGNAETLFGGYTSGTVNGVTVRDAKSSTGTLSMSNMFAGTSLTLWGWIGYDEAISSFGYYFDDQSDSIFSSTPVTPETAVINIGGQNAKRFRIVVDTASLSAGDHTLTFVTRFEHGQVLTLTTWKLSIRDKATSDKPMANVIILSGQSNAYGASPITPAVRAQYGNKTYSNVYIHYNNINVVADNSADGGTWKTLFSNNGFEQYRLGIGAQSTTYLGPELGIVDYLTSNGYADDTPLYIIKFTAAGTFLNGQWFPGVYDPHGLVADMGDYLYNQMVDYISDSLSVISQNYSPKIQAFFWVQGESDSGDPNVAGQYASYEQNLVNGIRTNFAMYASDSGISFINYAIAETPEGNINWVYSSTINSGKKSNCAYWFDPEKAAGEQIIVNSAPNISNSYIVISDVLRSKATAGDYESNGQLSTDYAHMCGEDMAILGQWMGAGMLYLKELYWQ